MGSLAVRHNHDVTVRPLKPGPRQGANEGRKTPCKESEAAVSARRRRLTGCGGEREEKKQTGQGEKLGVQFSDTLLRREAA